MLLCLCYSEVSPETCIWKFIYTSCYRISSPGLVLVWWRRSQACGVCSVIFFYWSNNNLQLANSATVSGFYFADKKALEVVVQSMQPHLLEEVIAVLKMFFMCMRSQLSNSLLYINSRSLLHSKVLKSTHKLPSGRLTIHVHPPEPEHSPQGAVICALAHTGSVDHIHHA